MIYIDPNTLSAEESYRINGALSTAHIEELLDRADLSDAMSSVDAHMSEASAQFPGEDFLQDIISELQILSKVVRGRNKEFVDNLLQNTESLQSEIAQAAEYGLDELKKARKLLE